MARQSLTPVVPFDMKDDITANAADLAWTAATGSSGSNGNQFPLTGREIILVWNQHASNPYTVTFSSKADALLKRSKDISAYSIGPGEIAAFVPYNLDGWLQSDGNLYCEAESTSVKFCILRPKQLL